MTSKSEQTPIWVLSGDIDGVEERFDLPPGRYKVGSSPASDIRLTAASVSRQHALLVVSAEGVVVEDRGSTNGTAVDGHRVRRSAVEKGAEVRFGSIPLRLGQAHPDEALLAITFDRAEPSGGQLSSLTAEASTAMLSFGHDEATSHWLPIISRFVDALPVGGRLELSSALAGLAGDLECPGAALIVWQGTEPSAVASHGELGDVPRIDTVMESAGIRGETRWTSTYTAPGPILAAFRAGGDSTPIALLLWGAAEPPPAGDEEPSAGADTALEIALEVLRRTVQRNEERQRSLPAEETSDLRFPPGYIRGTSPAMNELYEQMRMLLHGDTSVLIAGETGVGKETIAQILHLSSERSDGPFVAINCAALPEELLEAEMFGIEKGVATGVEKRQGRFREARGGTLFLDEIGEMPASLQAKLLRALQEKEISPLGGRPQSVDVRILAATNVDLTQVVADGSLRADLFYRLAGFVLTIPPLRRRRADIPALIERFLGRFVEQRGIAIRGVTVGALRTLVAYDWPGNVRELENEMRRLSFRCPGGRSIEESMISETVLGAEPSETFAEDSLELGPRVDALEREMICQALRRTHGKKVAAAELLGLSRNGLSKKMTRLGIEPAARS